MTIKIQMEEYAPLVFVRPFSSIDPLKLVTLNYTLPFHVKLGMPWGIGTFELVLGNCEKLDQVKEAHIEF